MTTTESSQEYLARVLTTVLHNGMKYDGDKDYTFHLQMAVDILVSFGYYSEDYIIACRLHDSVEDTQLSLKLINQFFGEKVARLVEAVTDPPGLTRRDKHEKLYPILRANQDAVPIKLADRIANVTYSLDNGSNMWKMYYKEHPYFEGAVREEGKHDSMWEHLNQLFRRGLANDKD